MKVQSGQCPLPRKAAERGEVIPSNLLDRPFPHLPEGGRIFMLFREAIDGFNAGDAGNGQRGGESPAGSRPHLIAGRWK
ncbi:hypothetical protein ACQ3G6_01030 [Allorhizobium undicola]|uniref:hypothetical protein n=1 Tax=Allorhizobium undicola TaxID=78527 RepID=UPI003D34336F